MKFIVYSTRDDKNVEIHSSAQNWGSLKAEVIANGINPNEMKAVLKETKSVLEDATIFPSDLSTITIILTPSQMKSGLKK